MKKSYLFNALIFLFITSSAFYSPLTAQEFQWVSNLDNNNNHGLKAMASDTAGNFYLAGNYFDGNCTGCLYIAKYNADGDEQWLKTFEKGTGTHIAVSADGKIVVSGTYTGTLQIETTTLTSSGGTDIFLSSFDTDGNAVWAVSMGSARAENSTALAVATDGTIYVSGTYSQNIVIGQDTLKSKFSSGTFIAEYNANGALSNLIPLDGLQLPRIWDQVVDGTGNLIITGQFNDTLILNGTSAKGFANGDIFIAKIAAGGSVEFIKALGGNGLLTETGRAVATDANNNIYLAADFNGTVKFGNDSFTSLGYYDVALLKYSPAGEVQWVKHFKGQENDIPSKLLIVNDVVYIGGTYYKPLQIGDSVLAAYGTFADLFIGAYKTNGDFLWAQRAGSAYFETLTGLTATTGGDILICGFFGSSGPATTKTAYFGSHTISTNRSNGDIYVARLTTTELDSGVGIIETNFSAFAVYPNPMQAGSPYLTIDLPLQENSRLSVYSTTGKLLHTAQLNRNDSRTTVQMPGLAPGMYFLRLNSNKQVYHSKILVE